MISDARNGHVSPGIYIEEKDVTYSVKSLGITSLGLVGETLYGPAFENIPIKDWAEFVDYFGGTSTEKFSGTGLPKYELPYIAKSYLEESNRLNVVRVLGLSGYNAGPAWAVKTDKGVVAVLRSKMEYENYGDGCDEVTEGSITSIVNTITKGEYVEYTIESYCKDEDTDKEDTTEGRFSITVNCINGDTYTYNLSLNSGDNTYIYNVLSNRPDTGTTPVYIEAVFEANKGNVTEITKLEADEYANYYEAYRPAITPWIVSDAEISKSGFGVKKLFRFITISDGNISNNQVKISIQNIDPISGAFDILVRDFYDKDDSMIVLERFPKCNLVDGDSNYIAYKIGTSDGGFVSKSKYITVEMAESEDLRNRVPGGFLGYPMPTYGGDEKLSINYNKEYNNLIKVKKQYFGFSNLTGIESDIFSYKGKFMYSNGNDENPNYITNGFHLDSLLTEGASLDGSSEKYYFDCVSKETNYPYVPRLVKNSIFLNQSLYSDIKTRKFTVCFYGGFDGWDVNRKSRTNTNNYRSTSLKVSEDGPFRHVYNNEDLNSALKLPNTAVTSDYYAYLAGYRVFANPQDVDINLFATPGINWYDNTSLTEEAIDVIEDKEDGRGGDALYVMASPNITDVFELSSTFNECGINSSHACTYAPWVMYYDASNKKYLNLPVTKDVVRNMAATDNNSYPWFAPAGMERGSVNCVKAEFKTTLVEEDELYENRINPVKTFAQDGVKIWGNKTAYNVESPLNRINVRRLMIRVQKLVKNAAKNLIFTQYDDTLDKQFKGLIEPILSDVKANRGISDYRIITEVTPETRDQHILPAKILIKPTPALEYISISFVVYPDSVSFDEN